MDRIIRAQDPQKDQDQPSGQDGSRDRRDPGSWRLFSRASTLFSAQEGSQADGGEAENRERKKRTAREAPASPAPRPAAPLSEESPMARKKGAGGRELFCTAFSRYGGRVRAGCKTGKSRSMRRLALKKREALPGAEAGGRFPGQAAASTAAGQKARIHAELLGIFIFPVPQTKLTAKESAQRAAVKRKSEERSPIFIPYLQKITYDIILAGGIFGSRYSNLNGKLIQ